MAVCFCRYHAIFNVMGYNCLPDTHNKSINLSILPGKTSPSLISWWLVSPASGRRFLLSRVNAINSPILLQNHSKLHTKLSLFAAFYSLPLAIETEDSVLYVYIYFLFLLMKPFEHIQTPSEHKSNALDANMVFGPHSHSVLRKLKAVAVTFIEKGGRTRLNWTSATLGSCCVSWCQ